MRSRLSLILMIMLFRSASALKFLIFCARKSIRSILNELMLIITELRKMHEREKNRTCLKHWKKMIFLTSTILKSLSLFFFSRIIVSQTTWDFSAIIQENNKLFHEKIIKNYINLIIKKFVNVFNEFVKRIKWINVKIFDINNYWNVMLIASIVSNSKYKLFILISNFFAFSSSEKLKVNIHSKQIVQ